MPNTSLHRPSPLPNVVPLGLTFGSPRNMESLCENKLIPLTVCTKGSTPAGRSFSGIVNVKIRLGGRQHRILNMTNMKIRSWVTGLPFLLRTLHRHTHTHVYGTLGTSVWSFGVTGIAVGVGRWRGCGCPQLSQSISSATDTPWSFQRPVCQPRHTPSVMMPFVT